MKKCVLCSKELEPALDDWETYQPYGGCEIKIIGSFGSTKFDENISSTVFRGVICDDCASKLVPEMDKQTPVDI